jgi:hypothetical protein
MGVGVEAEGRVDPSHPSPDVGGFFLLLGRVLVVGGPDALVESGGGGDAGVGVHGYPVPS